MKTTATQTDAVLNKKSGNIRFHLPPQSKVNLIKNTLYYDVYLLFFLGKNGFSSSPNWWYKWTKIVQISL